MSSRRNRQGGPRPLNTTSDRCPPRPCGAGDGRPVRKQPMTTPPTITERNDAVPAGASNSVVLEVEGITRTFGPVRALDDVSLQLSRGRSPRPRRRERFGQVHPRQDHLRGCCPPTAARSDSAVKRCRSPVPTRRSPPASRSCRRSRPPSRHMTVAENVLFHRLRAVVDRARTRTVRDAACTSARSASTSTPDAARRRWARARPRTRRGRQGASRSEPRVLDPRRGDHSPTGSRGGASG